MAVPSLSSVGFRAHLDPAMQRRLERLGLADKPGRLFAPRYTIIIYPTPRRNDI
jgi:hypothetical protein